MHTDLASSPSCHDDGQKTLPDRNDQIPLVTLVGQPNSGKTTLFNALTGANFKTSNYPGTTVEFSAGTVSKKFSFDCLVLDSPGITSLYPKSPDEETSINALFDHPIYRHPEIVVVTADASQLGRQLYLAKQIIDCKFQVIIAVTMSDLLEKKGFEIAFDKLEHLLECPIVKVNPRLGQGIDQLVDRIQRLHASANAQRTPLQKAPDLTEAFVINLYEFTEDVEHQVIFPKGKKVDIEKINREFFNFQHHKPDAFSLKIDRFVLHPLWGAVFFFVSMGIVFTSIFWMAQPLMDLISQGFGWLGDLTATLLPDSWIGSLLAQGLIGGVGTVMTFLPQIIILFFLMGILEDTGYLSRAAMLVDKPLSKIGLNGRSFVPMLSGFACAIPATMAARTIPNKRERWLTIFIIPLMSCSARLPVYALLFAFVTPPGKPWIAGILLGAVYLLSLINGSLAAGLIDRLTRRHKKMETHFMLELPAYRRPVPHFVFKTTFYKSITYIKKAGPAIVMCSLIIWAMTYFPNISPQLAPSKTVGLDQEHVTKLLEAERLNTSFAADVGHVFEPVLQPLGWDWRIGVALISAFVAREVFVSAMALTFHITETEEGSLNKSILQSMRESKIAGSDKPLFTLSSTIALIIFFMFAMQCFSTLAIVRKETGSWKIPILQQLVYTGVAYIFALGAVNALKALGID